MYTTKDKVKEFKTLTDKISDPLLDILIKNTSKAMDNYVGYKIATPNDVAGEDYLFDGSGTDYIDLVGMRFKDFETITLDDVDITSDALPFPLNSDYISGFDRKRGVFTAGKGNVTLTNAKIGAYTIDFDMPEHNLPEDIEMACTLLVSALCDKYIAEGQEKGAVTSEKTSQYSVNYADLSAGGNTLVNQAWEMLSDYKTFGIA